MESLKPVPHRYPFIAIAGNIGVGKTSLTRLIYERWAWQPLYESAHENPYLQDFYGDMGRWAFHSQVYFLSRRLVHHRQLLEFEGAVVQDRTIYEDAEIFATNLARRGILSTRDYETYRVLYEGMVAMLPAPHLLVYLKASVGLLAERIALRGRDYERTISIAYLSDLNELYDEWAQHTTLFPVLTVDANDLDYVNHPADFEQVLASIVQHLPPELRP